MPARRSLFIVILALLSLFSPRLALASKGACIATHLPALDLALSASTFHRLWAYDGARIVAEFDGTGAMLSRFVYSTRPNVPEYMLKGGELYRILSDHLGSVRLVVKVSDGSIVEQIKYDPWGAIESPTPPSFQPFAFAGGLYDPDTKLLRFGARDYDPATGRWTAKEPREAPPFASETPPFASEACRLAREARPLAREMRPFAREARRLAREARPLAKEARRLAREAPRIRRETQRFAEKIPPFARDDRPRAPEAHRFANIAPRFLREAPPLA